MLNSGKNNAIETDLPNVSVECLDAIEMLLKKDPNERISIFDFLQHPWIEKYKRWKETKIWGRNLDDDDDSLSVDSLSAKGEEKLD